MVILFIWFLLCITKYKHNFIRTILISILISSRDISISFSIYQKNIINIIPYINTFQAVQVLILFIALADNAYLMLRLRSIHKIRQTRNFLPTASFLPSGTP